MVSDSAKGYNRRRLFRKELDIPAGAAGLPET
jgi:hypothetical protein